MKILFLCEGDPETHDSWSGVSRSLVMHLREAGHTVIPGDVDLYGLARARVAARTLSVPRKRWWVRYHLDTPAFRARSARAAAHVRAADAQADVILQIGATFQVPGDTTIPIALFCDSNILFARDAGSAGYSEASVLSEPEVEAIRTREAAVYRTADLIFTMSDLVRRSFMNDFDISPDRLLTIHCAPNVPFPTASQLAAETGRDPPIVLFVGRDFDRKGADLLLAAFPEVRRSVPDARLRFVGCKAPSDPPPWAEFVGFQSRDTAEGREAMDRFYKTASAFCLPTRFEPFGTSFVEAMGYGLPCIGPDAWAIPEIIVDGETGYIVPPEDPHAIAQALVRVLEDPEHARDMGNAGRERALAHFTWPGITRRMIDALNHVTAQGSASALEDRSGDDV